NTIDGGFAMAERFELDPVVVVGEGEQAVPTTRHPIRLSRTPATYRLPPPGLDEHGAELRKWLAEPWRNGRRGPGEEGRRRGCASRVPDRSRRLLPRPENDAWP